MNVKTAFVDALLFFIFFYTPFSVHAQAQSELYAGTLHDAAGGGPDDSYYRGAYLKWPGGHEDSKVSPGGMRSCSAGVLIKIVVRNWTGPSGVFHEIKEAYTPETGTSTPMEYRVRKTFRSLRTTTTVIDPDGTERTNQVEEEGDFFRVNHNLISDEMVEDWEMTDAGVVIKRTYYAWANREHDDYIIEKVVLKNTGNFDENPVTIEHPDNDIPELYVVYWSTLLLPCIKGEKLHSFNDTGDHDNYVDYYGREPADSIRIMYGFDGDDPDIPIDDRGDPFPERYVDDSRYNPKDIYDVGEFVSAMYAGYGVLHTDRSAADHTNDPGQPFTTGWASKFDVRNWQDALTWDNMLNQGIPGHRAHPDLTAPPQRYYQSFWMGFGPYQLSPGDSISLVFVHAAKGPNVERCKEVGLKWFNGEIAQDEKNKFLNSGKDSLFQTVGRAQWNWDHYLSKNVSIPMGPSQPQNLTVRAGGKQVTLNWTAPDVGEIAAYRIYRKEGTYFGDYLFHDEVSANETQYIDTLNVNIGVSYYYYVTAMNSEGIESTGHYNRINIPSRPFLGTAKNISKVRVVPNPYNYHQVNHWSGERNRITFANLTEDCTIRVFTVNGDLVKTFHHQSESGTEHWSPMLTDDNLFPAAGIYIYVVEDNKTGQRETGKFIIIR